MEFVEREFSERPLTEEEIRRIAGSGNVLELLNPARPAYAERGFDQRKPTEPEAIDALIHEANLIYRPIVIWKDRRILGLQEEAIQALIEEARASSGV